MSSRSVYESIAELLSDPDILFPASLFAKKNVPWAPDPAIDVSTPSVTGKKFIDSKGKVTFGVIWADAAGNLYEQIFNSTGLALGKKVKVGDLSNPNKNIYLKEVMYEVDLNDDGVFGLSVLIHDSKATKDLGDYNLLGHKNNGDQYLLGVSVGSAKGSIFNINTLTDLGVSKTLYLKMDSQFGDLESNQLDAYTIPFSGISAGFGSLGTGTVNVTDSTVSIGGAMTTIYLIDKYGFSGDFTVGGLSVGFGAKTKGTLNITGSDISVGNQELTDYAFVLFGADNNTSANVAITDSTINVDAITNIMMVGLFKGKGSLTVDQSTINLTGNNPEDPDSSYLQDNDDVPNKVSFGVGLQGSTGRATFKNSSLNLFAIESYIDVGNNSLTGSGSLSFTDSTVKSIASRLGQSEAYVTDMGSKAWMFIGNSEGHEDKKSGIKSSGSLTLSNSDFYLKGPISGLDLGIASNKAYGEVLLDNNSKIEFISGNNLYNEMDQLLSPWDGSTNVFDGYTYSSDVFVGGSYWAFYDKDYDLSFAGGTGKISIKNNSEMVMHCLDTSQEQARLDAILNPGDDPAVFADEAQKVTGYGPGDFSARGATLEIASMGTRGIVEVMGLSSLEVGGDILMATYGYQGVTPTATFVVTGGSTSTSQGFYANTNLNPSFQYFNNNTSYIYLNYGEINAKEISLQNKTKIVGSGTFNLILENAVSPLTSPNLEVAGNGSLRAEVYVGDNYAYTLNTKTVVTTDKITKGGTGTLTFDGDFNGERTASDFNFSKTDFYFDIVSATNHDSVIFKDAADINFDQIKFYITKSANVGSGPITLVEFDNVGIDSTEAAAMFAAITLVGEGHLTADTQGIYWAA